MAISHPAVKTRFRDLFLVFLAYMVALLAALLVGWLFSNLHVLYMVLLADIAGTLVIYLAGRIFRNASFYDPYWSVAPIVIAFFWVSSNLSSAIVLRMIFVLFLVFFWGLRLTLNWVRGWQGIKHEDWRYRDFREKSGKWFWLMDLFGIELAPTMFVYLGCLSLYPALALGDRAFGILDILATIITAGAVLVETTADEQMKSFFKSNPPPDAVMSSGLWKYSRHPNYFGEVAFWWGLFLFGLAAAPGYWWTIIGPVAITLLFIAVSIPMMEKRQTAKRPAYAEYRKRVSAFILWFPGSK